MSQLFSPYTLGKLHLKNRIVVPPMCQYSASEGLAGEWHMAHLSQLALSGAALVIIEATGVSPEARISNACLGLWDDKTQHALAQVMAQVKKNAPETPFMIQLGHAGRKASTNIPWGSPRYLKQNNGGWTTFAPSAIGFEPESSIPQEMTHSDIKKVINDFASAAKRAQAIGLDGIEVHAAHGYLLHQFLSPHTNLRADEYGGQLDNRMRLCLEVFEAVRQAAPDITVGIRISATDWLKDQPSWDLDQSVVLINRLKKMGLDFVHVSTGGLSLEQKIPVGPGYQLSFANTIKKAYDLPTIAVGMLDNPSLAEQVLIDNQADLIGIARGILYDPRWPWHAAAELGAQIDAAPQYWRCLPPHHSGLFKR